MCRAKRTAVAAVVTGALLLCTHVAPSFAVPKSSLQQLSRRQIVSQVGRGSHSFAEGLYSSSFLAAAAVVSSSWKRQSLRASPETTEASDLEAPEPEVKTVAEVKKVFKPEKQAGVCDPVGFFDPSGFTQEGDEDGFRQLRAAEVKHGRVAMMATVGFVAQCYFRFPGFEKVPVGVQALVEPPGPYGLVLLVLASGALELGPWKQDPTKEGGDFGDPLGLGEKDFTFDQDGSMLKRKSSFRQGVDDLSPAEPRMTWSSDVRRKAIDMRTRELNNGRFAMFAALGIIAAELETDKVAVMQFNF